MLRIQRNTLTQRESNGQADSLRGSNVPAFRQIRERRERVSSDTRDALPARLVTSRAVAALWGEGLSAGSLGTP